MRMKWIAALAVAATSVALAAPNPAEAGGKYEGRSAHSRYIPAPYPGGPDPYAYKYEKRGYYPYYDSNYWVPLRQMKGRTHYPYRIPRYYASWGYPLTCKMQRRHRNCGVPYTRETRRLRHW